VKLVALAAVVFALEAGAPFQCGHAPDPSLRQDDDAGDALWALAQKLESEHDEEGAKKALRFLVARYPSNRHVPAAKDELSRLDGRTGDGG
jgi:hypothetical protein